MTHVTKNGNSKNGNSLKKVLLLSLGALGIVYGDIGTSPLYAIKECFHGTHAISLSETNILGVTSLVFWSLLIVVSIKYVTFILKADNNKEGGIFALLALISPNQNLSTNTRKFIVVAAVFGAALLYGDGVITPAISVLSAVEGMEVATSAAKPAVLPITCVVLLTLFLVQSRGTEKIGRVFGPIMIVWFLTIALLGAMQVLANLKILNSINPSYAYQFFLENRIHGIVVLGSVVLCITGGEALYADMGHFGRSAIRLSWLGLAFPALLLNYFGQGALLLGSPELATNPFYGMVPRSFLYPMVGLSTAATVIASQAMISGVYSLTQQAIQLGFFPRFRIIHTSHETKGQIYIPGINYAMMVGCVGLVLAFKESSGLAGAYGIAVTATMGITSVIYYFVVTRVWKWSLWKALPLLVLFLGFDLAYFGANLFKFFDGGWFTITIALMILVVMMTWNKGRTDMAKKRSESRFPLSAFLEDIAGKKPHRVSGTAVFMSISPVGTPISLLHNLKHNKILHEQVIILTIKFTETPYLTVRNRLTIEDLGQGFYRIKALYGYMETPNVPMIMKAAKNEGLPINLADTTYYLGSETLITSGDTKMSKWRKALFAVMSRNANSAVQYFGLPVGRVVELGIQVEL